MNDKELDTAVKSIVKVYGNLPMNNISVNAMIDAGLRVGYTNGLLSRLSIEDIVETKYKVLNEDADYGVLILAIRNAYSDYPWTQKTFHQMVKQGLRTGFVRGNRDPKTHDKSEELLSIATSQKNYEEWDNLITGR